MSPVKSSKALDELSGMVVSAELTLISIIQGAALYFLVNTSYEPIANLQYQYWLYTAAGLAIIFTVWSRTLAHIFTLIRWPLEFGHNFLYIAITLFESVLFTQLMNVKRWVVLSAAFWFLAWVTFVFDLRMIRALKSETSPGKYRELIQVVEDEQMLNIRVFLPLATLFYAGVALAMHRWPALATDRSAIALGASQLLGLLGYLAYSIAFYNRITPLILESRAEG